MTDEQLDILASQLFAIHEEALGELHSWEDLKTTHKTAWIMVAQFIEATYIQPEPDHK